MGGINSGCQAGSSQPIRESLLLLCQKAKTNHTGSLGAASEPMNLPFRQQRPEDQETPTDTEKVWATRLEEGTFFVT